MIDVNKPLAIHLHGNVNPRKARFIGRSSDVNWPLVVEGLRANNSSFVFLCDEQGRRQDGGPRVFNVVNENLPEEW